MTVTQNWVRVAFRFMIAHVSHTNCFLILPFSGSFYQHRNMGIIKQMVVPANQSGEKLPGAQGFVD